VTDLTSPPDAAAIATLDVLVWNALTTTHARFAIGDGPARRYDPEVAGFVAIESDTPEAWAALADLMGPGETVLLSGDLTNAPPTWGLERAGSGYQMVLGDLAPAPAIDGDIIPLTAVDVPEMLALVELTKPGPFRPRTIELGNYVGIRSDDQLIAMAGERLQTPHFTEVSAVCTHPTARGRGLAAALSHRVATGILARGQTPMLHVAKANVNAKRVYERLGFTARRELPFVAARTPDL
jgi:ribosomal protein S18 acetylase RimI-like enzyme